MIPSKIDYKYNELEGLFARFFGADKMAYLFAAGFKL